MAGLIDVAFASLPSVSGAIKQGALRAIAVTSGKRAAAFGNIPTIAESKGFARFDVDPWFGPFAPAKMPPEIVRKINAAVNHGPEDARGRREVHGAGRGSVRNGSATVRGGVEGGYREVGEGGEGVGGEFGLVAGQSDGYVPGPHPRMKEQQPPRGKISKKKGASRQPVWKGFIAAYVRKLRQKDLYL